MIYPIFFQQLLYGILTLLITYTIGKLILLFLRLEGNFFFRLFVTYIIGITAIVLSYSTFKTHGRTVNILLLPLMVYLIYFFRKSFSTNFKFNKKEIVQEFVWSLLPFALMFLYQCWFYFDFCKGELKPLFGDYYWYATFSDSLKLWGAENYFTSTNFFFPQFRHGLMPYHYPELWLNAFFSSIFSISTLNSYYFLICTLLPSIFIIGIASLLKSISTNKILLSFIAFVLCFISGINVPYISHTLQNDVWSIMCLGQKTAFIYIFILLGMILLKDKKIYESCIVFSIIPLFTITLFPAIVGGLTFFFISIIFINKGKDIKQYAILMGFMLIIIVGFGIFYSINKSVLSSNFSKTITSSGIFHVLKNGLTFKNIITVMLNFFVYALPTIVIHVFLKFSTFILFFLVFWKSTIKLKILSFFVILLVIMGAVGATLANTLHDSEQFNGITNIIVITFCIVLIANYLEKKERSFFMSNYAIGGIVVILILFSIPKIVTEKGKSFNPDMKFIKEASRFLSKDTVVVLSLFSKDEIQQFPFYNIWFANNEINALSQYSNKTIVYVLGNPEHYVFKQNKSREFDSLCYNFLTPLTIWKKKGYNYNLESFIKMNKIKYIYVKAGAKIPRFIHENTENTITSQATHCQFLKLR